MASCSRRSRTGSSNTLHQSLYAIGGIALTWVAVVLDSLNCDGTGATGGWYLGPRAQADSDITRASPIAKALDRVVGISSLLRSAALCRLHRHDHSIDQIVGRIGDQRVRLAVPAQDSDVVPEIAAECDVSKLSVMLAVHDADLWTLGLEENGVARKHER